MTRSRFRCNVIPYRKGFLEVLPDIHVGCINVEAWQVRYDFDISNRELEDDSFPDDAITGNVELEISVVEAEDLIQTLTEAVAKMKARG
jgi:hypothetical protein